MLKNEQALREEFLEFNKKRAPQFIRKSESLHRIRTHNMKTTYLNTESQLRRKESIVKQLEGLCAELSPVVRSSEQHGLKISSKSTVYLGKDRINIKELLEMRNKPPPSIRPIQPLIPSAIQPIKLTKLDRYRRLSYNRSLSSFPKISRSQSTHGKKVATIVKCCESINDDCDDLTQAHEDVRHRFGHSMNKLQSRLSKYVYGINLATTEGMLAEILQESKPKVNSHRIKQYFGISKPYVNMFYKQPNK